MSTPGLRFIASMLDRPTSEYIKLGDVSPLFSHMISDQEHFVYVREFLQKHGKLPERDTFEQQRQTPLPTVKEPLSFYRDELLGSHVKRGIIKMADEMNEMMSSKNPLGALELMTQYVRQTETERFAPNLFDFRHSHDILVEAMKEKGKEGSGIMLGWPYFDEIANSLRAGDMVSIVGRPAAGKSYLALRACLNVWRNKRPVLFVSMEMNPVLVFERLAAIQTSTAYDWLKNMSFPKINGKNTFTQFKGKLMGLQNEENPLWVVDGNLTATCGDIIGLTQSLKPGLVMVDGAYLLGTSGQNKKGFEKVAEIARGLKQGVATTAAVPVVTSWQFNRESGKVKKPEDVGLEHIAGSDEIGQLSSIVLGLFQEESVETLTRRKIDIMKGRSGEKGSFYVNWDFKNMNFDQCDDEPDLLLD